MTVTDIVIELRDALNELKAYAQTKQGLRAESWQDHIINTCDKALMRSIEMMREMADEDEDS